MYDTYEQIGKFAKSLTPTGGSDAQPVEGQDVDFWEKPIKNNEMEGD